MVNVVTSSKVDRGFDSRSGQTNDYRIGTGYYSDKHASNKRYRKQK